jgi:Nif-specific regulatory protein
MIPVENLDQRRYRLACHGTAKQKTLCALPPGARETLEKTLVGKSAAMLELKENILKLCRYDTTVLIQGESGTGKELVANMLHALSPRSPKKFVAINCAAMPEQLLEALLFGYERGSFTGADRQTKGYLDNASGGTLFLDEISETSVSFQAKLLRVLQEKAFYRLGGHELIPADVRILSATNQDFQALAKGGKFRRDLFYRLSVVKVATPPLRVRKEDIPELALHFLQEVKENLNGEIPAEGFSDSAMAMLMNYAWPGNARELRNTIEHAAIFTHSVLIEPGDFPKVNGDDKALLEKRGFSSEGPGMSFEGLTAVDLREARRRFEEGYFLELYRETGQDMKEIARRAGVDLATVYRKFGYLRKADPINE